MAGQIVVPVTGDYQFQTYSNGSTQRLARRQAANRSLQAELGDRVRPVQGAPRSPAGAIRSRVTEQRSARRCAVTWKTPSPASRRRRCGRRPATAIDYYFLYGPEIDRVIAGYRTLTGRASMLPDWAFGFWQSKNKYNTQAEVLEHARRSSGARQIPVDSIVQDWQYWPPDAWGDHEFEASRYPDPAGDDQGDPRQHARFMISVWGKFYPVTEQLQGAGRDRRAVPDDHRRTGTRDWLNHDVRVLRRLQRAGAQAVLGAGQSRAVQQGRRRLVDGRDRARSRAAVAADARVAASQRRSDGDRHRVAGDERVPADEQRGGLRRPAQPSRRTSASSSSRAPGSPAFSATRRSPGRATSRRRVRRCASRSPPASGSRSPARRTGRPIRAATRWSRASPRRGTATRSTNGAS